MRPCATASAMTHIEKMRFQRAMQALSGNRTHQMPIRSANPHAALASLGPFAARLGIRHYRPADSLSFGLAGDETSTVGAVVGPHEHER